MAFLSTPAPLAHSNRSAFAGARRATSARTPQRLPAARTLRMAATSDKDASTESPEVAKAGDSMWKETLLAGGFPGGEEFLKAWVEDGMTKEVPDMPSRMQPKADFTEKTVEKGGVLGRLDGTEFFKKFVGSDSDPAVIAEATEQTAVAPEAAAAAPRAKPLAPAAEDEALPATGLNDPEAPDEALYAPYFPRDKRYLAPEIVIRCEGTVDDRVSMSMQEVTARASDRFFPKSEQYIGPVISIKYNGSLATASVKLEMKEIEGLPTLPPPARPGQAVTKLVPGAGGGLKLTYEIEGQGQIKL